MAYVAYFLPVALRQMSGAVIQVAEDLENASRVAGAGQMRTLVRIVFPLLIPAMFGGFLLAFITFVREFVTSVLLFSSGNEVVSVVMYSYYSNGRLPDVAVIAVVLSFMVFVLIGVAGRVFNFRISF
jgi:iron(III) transport system permease protein